MKRKVVPTKASPLSMGYRKPAFLSGVASLVKNASQAKEDYDNMKEMLRLKRENEELRKENLFLKKAAAFFAKEID
jgi:hypothetical protein